MWIATARELTEMKKPTFARKQQRLKVPERVDEAYQRDRHPSTSYNKTPKSSHAVDSPRLHDGHECGPTPAMSCRRSVPLDRLG